MERDVPALWGEGASLPQDTWIFGLHVHLLEEDTQRPALGDLIVHRGEGLLEVGYLLAIPAPTADITFALRGSAWGGLVSLRELRPEVSRHRVSEKLLAKLGLGLEASFREGLSFAFLQLTFRADDQTFGGGNVQVTMQF